MKQMRRFAKKMATVVLTCAVAMTVCVTGYGAVTDVPEADAVRQNMTDTADYIKSLYDTTQVGVLDYKNVILLMRSGINCSDLTEKYLQKVKDSMTDGKILVDSKENLTVDAAVLIILALDGKDPKDFNGANLVKNFNDLAAGYKSAADMNTAVGNVYYYEIIVPAVFAYAEHMEDSQSIKETIKSAMLLNYGESGDQAGIDYWGYSTDNNATVIPALNMFAETDDDVRAKVQKATDFVVSLMMPDGGNRFDTADYSTESNANSTGVALKFYSEMNQTENAVKSYNGLMNFKSTTNKGMYTYYGTDNAYATRDAFTGLIAYYMNINNMGSVFDVSGEVYDMYNPQVKDPADSDEDKKADDEINTSQDENEDNTEDDAKNNTDTDNEEADANADDADNVKDKNNADDEELDDDTLKNAEAVVDDADKTEVPDTSDSSDMISMIILMSVCASIVWACNRKLEDMGSD